MYNSVKKSIRAITLASSVIILTACGGGGASETSGSGGGAVINKPNPSSMAASSIAEQSSSEPKSSSAPQATVSSFSSINKSSSATSSETYVRASRSSSSQPTQNTSTANTSSSLSSSDTDTIPPSGTTLFLYRVSENSITLLWEEATDNVGISHFEIERDGQVMASIYYPAGTFLDYNLLANTDYQYTITVFDKAGNKSGKSPAFSVRTLAHANSSNSSNPTSSTGTSNSSQANSSTRSSSANSSLASNKTTIIRWSHPNKRENGQFLELDEISGYEIRFKPPTQNTYTYISLSGNRTTSLSTDLIPTSSTIEIAVHDINGLYSSFIPISPKTD